jgi:hypothetical protein
MGLGLKDEMTGATAGAVTVRVAELLTWPFGLVTCTGKVWALVPTLTCTITCVELICDP